MIDWRSIISAFKQLVSIEQIEETECTEARILSVP